MQTQFSPVYSARSWNYARQKGMSIVEVMIALTIGTILTVGVVQLFVANSETYKLLVGQSRMQESARFGLEFISRTVRMAGYKGCYSVNGRVNTTIDPPTNVPFEYNITKSIEAYDWTADDSWTPDFTTDGFPYTNTVTSVDKSFAPGNGVHYTPSNANPDKSLGQGSDILVIRHLSENQLDMTDMLTSSDNVVVSVPADEGLDFGCVGCVVAGVIPARTWDDLLLIYDCEKSTIFRVTHIANDSPAAGKATISHDTSDADATQNLVAQLAEFNTFEGLDAGIAAIVTNIFYIAPGAGKNNQDKYPMSLWKKTGTSKPVELVEGVEDLQVEFGVDTDNDDVPNQYLRPGGAFDAADIVTVRVQITTNSVDDVNSTSKPTHGCTRQHCITGEEYDGLMRRTFSQTLQIRNKG